MTAIPALPPSQPPAQPSVVELPPLRKRWIRRALVVIIITATVSAGESLREFLLPAYTGWQAHTANTAVAATLIASLIFSLRNVGVFLSRLEVTALLDAQHALHESQAKLQLILNSTAEAIYGIDLEGQCTFCNPASLRLLGYHHPEDLLGKDMHTLIHHPHNDGTNHLRADCPSCQALLHNEGTHRNEELLWRADGTSFTAECWSSPLHDGDRVLGAVINFVDITDRLHMQRQLLTAARTDKLTGLPNRTVLLEKIQAAIDSHKRSPTTHYALLFLDFDRFKLVNDTLGHLAGDELLCEIAGRLESTVRTSDFIAPSPHETTTTRLGGDEFVILFTGLRSTADASPIADRLVDVLQQPYTIANQRIRSTASIGIVTSDIPHRTAADLLRDADTAMYQAKSAGKARAALFTPAMRAQAHQEPQLEIAAP